MSDRASTPARRRRAQDDAAPTLVTERDRQILSFVAEHRIVLAAHVQTLLGVSEGISYRRLGGLVARGLLKHDRVFHGQPGWYQITRPGLAIIGSDLPPPRVDLRGYRHDIGIAWVSLAASRGAFGRVDRVVSEREMRSRDAGGPGDAGDATRGPGHDRRAGHDEPGRSTFGVHLGGVGPRGQVRLHYPDLLLVGGGGHRVALELELTAKGGRRLETILSGYGADPAIAAVVYLSDKPAILREIRATADRLGISHMVHVRPVVWPAGTDPGTALEQARAPVARAGGRAAPAGARSEDAREAPTRGATPAGGRATPAGARSIRSDDAREAPTRGATPAGAGRPDPREAPAR